MYTLFSIFGFDFGKTISLSKLLILFDDKHVFVMLLYPELFNSFKSNAITAMLFKKTNQWVMIYYNEFKKGFIWYCSNDLIYITANIVWKLTKDGTTYFALEIWIEILTLHTLHRDDYSIETTIRISLFFWNGKNNCCILYDVWIKLWKIRKFNERFLLRMIKDLGIFIN